MLETFTLATFSGRLGETFRLRADAAHMIDLELLEATDLGERSAPIEQRKRTPFSIVFRGPRNVVLPQQIYRVEHDAIGAFELFLVPIGPDQSGMRYEAIFT